MNFDNSFIEAPLVSICSLIYNQEAYLEDFFKHILNQKTDFKFELLIHDDASTDNSSTIIKKYQSLYPTIIKPIFQTENQYSQGIDINLTYNFTRVQGKYIALCEGDDYWTDSLKLQKQVDFLETHSEYNLYCHNWDVDRDGVISASPVDHLYQQPFTFEFATLPWVWITKTATLMLRHQAFDYTLLSRYKYSRDVHLVYHFLSTGKGYYYPEIMSRYRIHNDGIWGKKGQYEKYKTNNEVYKEFYYYEKNRAIRKRYFNAKLALFNYQLYNSSFFKNLFKHCSLYFQCLKLIRDYKDIAFAFGALFPTNFITWIMKTFKI